MGFNVSVIGQDYIDTCDEFIERAFYVFTCQYLNEGELSLLCQMERMFNLNLKFLGDFQYTEDDIGLTPEERDEMGMPSEIELKWTDAEEALSTVEQLIQRIEQNPTFFKTLNYHHQHSGYGNSMTDFGRYVTSGELTQHLEIVCKILKCYISNSIQNVYFTAG